MKGSLAPSKKDTAAMSDRGRQTDRRGGESNSTRSSSRSRRTSSKSRAPVSSNAKKLKAADLFGDDSDSSSVASSKKSSKSKRSVRSTGSKDQTAKRDKSPTKKSMKVNAIDIFGGSFSDLSECKPSNAADDSSVSSRNSRAKWIEGDAAVNQKEFEKLVKERKALKSTVDQMKKENSELRKEVRNSEEENRKLRQALADGAGNSHKLNTLQEENARLNRELKETVERASTMVKERESATDQLLEELELLREESDRTRVMFDTTLYKSKKKTEELDHQNDVYARKIQELERRLESLGK